LNVIGVKALMRQGEVQYAEEVNSIFNRGEMMEEEENDSELEEKKNSEETDDSNENSDNKEKEKASFESNSLQSESNNLESEIKKKNDDLSIYVKKLEEISSENEKNEINTLITKLKADIEDNERNLIVVKEKMNQLEKNFSSDSHKRKQKNKHSKPTIKTHTIKPPRAYWYDE
jgi:predicted RNase H-like nuclease (RuvC/YqgF family)